MGLRHIANGATDFAAWSAALMQDMGDVVQWVARKSGHTPDAVARKIYSYTTAAAKQLGLEQPQGETPAAKHPAPDTGVEPANWAGATEHTEESRARNWQYGEPVEATHTDASGPRAGVKDSYPGRVIGTHQHFVFIELDSGKKMGPFAKAREVMNVGYWEPLSSKLHIDTGVLNTGALFREKREEALYLVYCDPTLQKYPSTETLDVAAHRSKCFYICVMGSFAQRKTRFQMSPYPVPIGCLSGWPKN